MKLPVFLQLLKQAGQTWVDTKASMLGAALSYYTVFSLAPLLVIALAVAGLVFGPQAARGELSGELKVTVGPTVAKAIEDLLASASNKPGAGPLAIVISTAVLLFGAAGVFGELQTALNTIWQVEPKPSGGVMGFLRRRFLSFSMVLGTCFLLLVSLVVTAALAALSKYWTPASMPGGTYLWQGVNLVVGLAVITALFALIFKHLPDAKIAWRDVWIGAAVTAVLFTVGRYVLGLYLGRGSATSAFGAAGSLVLVLTWVYYSAQIFLFGAAFTRVYADHYGRRIQPADNAYSVATKDPLECREPPAAAEPRRPEREPVGSATGGRR